jgi:hypothetical protein
VVGIAQGGEAIRCSGTAEFGVRHEQGFGGFADHQRIVEQISNESTI